MRFQAPKRNTISQLSQQLSFHRIHVDATSVCVCVYVCVCVCLCVCVCVCVCVRASNSAKNTNTGARYISKARVLQPTQLFTLKLEALNDYN